MKKIVIILSFAFTLQALLSKQVIAIQMTGTKLKLNLQFRSQTSSPSAATPNEIPKADQESNQKSNEETPQEQEVIKDLYEIRLGYGNVDISPMALAVSPRTIDFGNINPTSSVTRFQTVSIQKGPVPKYSLYLAEDHPPQDASGSGKFIPNTTGDKDKATTAQSAYWINPLTYGFGYRLRLLDKNAAGFELEDTYKQFPSIENGIPSQAVLRQETQDQELTTTIKMNIANNMSGYIYQNTIYYTLIPSL